MKGYLLFTKYNDTDDDNNYIFILTFLVINMMRIK